MRFDGNYREHVRLRDGATVLLRLVVPEDKAGLQHGLGQMSPRSQYLRFFTEKPRFTATELRYLTEIDGRDHVAIVALIEGDRGRNGVALGRFVRLGETPAVAEPAIVVVDAHQHRGLGSILFGRLIEAALERHVTYFRATFLSSNEPMRRLLECFAPAATSRRHGQLLDIQMDLRRTRVRR